MSKVEVCFGLLTSATLVLSWRQPLPRGAALLLAAIWLQGEIAYAFSWDMEDAIGQGVNALAGALLVVWAFYRLRPPMRRARPAWWLLALSATFAVQNYLHMAEQGALLQSGGADPWAVWRIKHALWAQLCAMNALQLVIVAGGPRANGLVHLLHRLLPDRPRGGRAAAAFITGKEAKR